MPEFHTNVNISYLSSVSHNERLVELVEDMKMCNKTERQEFFQELVLFSGSRWGRQADRKTDRQTDRQTDRELVGCFTLILILLLCVHARIRQVLSDGVQFSQRFFIYTFLVDEGREDPNNTISRPSSARQRNLSGVSLACR